LLTEYLDIWEADQEGQALFNRLNVGYVVLGAEKSKSKLARYLAKNPQWSQVYKAKDGLVWVRHRPATAWQR
jgi:uncharacterized protein YpmB